MDRTALDALNKGWALGLATRVHCSEADFEAALARHEPVERKPRQSALLQWVVLLAAIGPMPRPQH